MKVRLSTAYLLGGKTLDAGEHEITDPKQLASLVRRGEVKQADVDKFLAQSGQALAPAPSTAVSPTEGENQSPPVDPFAPDQLGVMVGTFTEAAKRGLLEFDVGGNKTATAALTKAATEGGLTITIAEPKKGDDQKTPDKKE
jgi:hypothetical protein